MSTPSSVRARRAKFVPPSPSPWMVSRPRLAARLGDARLFPVTLVSAAAGSGKTTLLAEWVRSLDLPWGWLSLDEDDAPLDLLLTNLITAVQLASPDIGESTLSLLRLETDPSLDLLVAELDEDLLNLNQDVIVVLDDVHTIRDPHAVEFLQRFLQHPPPRLHLVLGARRDPPLPLARLRSRGQLLEIRAADLAFSADETRDLLQNAGLSSDLAESLERRNEGWVAGIHLGALALRGRSSSSRGVDDIVSAGVHDLIVHDILAMQPESEQRLLLVSSLVDRFTDGLCAALLEGADARNVQVRPILQEIAAEGLLLNSLGGEPEWFRYHQIFREALQREFRQRVTAEELSQLQMQASTWFEQSGLIFEAIEHALLSGQPDAAAAIIERNAQRAIAEDQWFELGHWLERLPESVVRSRSELMLAQAWVFQCRGDHIGLLSAVERARLLLDLEAPLHDECWRLARQAETDILAMHMGPIYEDPQRTIVAGEILERHAPERYASAIGLYQGAFARIVIGERDSLEADLRRSVAANQGVDDPFSRQRAIWARIVLGVQCLLDGRVAESAQLAVEVTGLAQSYGLRRLTALGWYWQGWLAYDQNQLDEAITLLERAVHERSSGIVILLSSSFGLVRALDAVGRTPEADNVMARLIERHAPEGQAPFGKALVLAFAAERALQRGDLATANRWMQAVRVWRPEAEFVTIDHAFLLRIQILIATNQLLEAHRALEQAEATAARPPLVMNYRLRVKALRALHTYVSGDRERAVSELRAAGALAIESGHIRALLDLGIGSSAFQELLVQLPAGELPLPSADMRRLYFVAQGSSGQPGAPESTDRLSEHLVYEQLTDRERDVVDGLMRRLSYKEIAYELGISPVTVKSHTTRIYGKLGVSSRRQMIRLLEQRTST